jgi:hypothetical protein
MPVAIWAPHPDDEIIGTYGVLSNPNVTVYYQSEFNSDPGIVRAAAMFGFKTSYLNIEHRSWDVVYAPSDFDFHPLHQRISHQAQAMFRDGCINRLIFYTTTMMVPFVFEEPNPELKRAALNYCYPEKRSLWEYDHRYFLFCGHWELLRP